MEPGGGTERGDGGCFLYYAYGSNLLRERLLLSSPSAALCAVARLQVRAGEPGAAVPRVGGGSPCESACPVEPCVGLALLPQARWPVPPTGSGAAVARFGRDREGGSQSSLVPRHGDSRGLLPGLPSAKKTQTSYNSPTSVGFILLGLTKSVRLQVEMREEL